ncbi:MAG: hypothetical protein MPN21_22830 [Thermoanaerobaculia bacterium]|nr:hypothetical protein [Thermoanaerobaculia bacterium]
MSEHDHHETQRDAEDSAERYQERLSALLESLPRESASEDFTVGVLRRLPANDTNPVYVRPWALVAAALVLLTVAVGFREWRHQLRQQEAIERIAEIRAEYEVLQRELDALKARASENRVVYLGEADGTEVVLDLARLPNDQARWDALRALQAGLLQASPPSPDIQAQTTGVRTADYRPDSSGPVYY